MSNFPTRRSILNRRHFLRGLGAAVALPLVDRTMPLRAETARPTLHVYEDYGWLRGFGMVPSWAANVVDAWRLYDGARFREEVALARQVHANCIRLWIEYAAWKTDPEKITSFFTKEGKLRDGLEFLTEAPKLRPPWEKS